MGPRGCFPLMVLFIGGFGKVKLVTDKQTGAPYALKVVPYGFQTQSTEQLAMQEAATLQSLVHPNVVRLQHFWNKPGLLWGGDLYLLMEYCERGSLRQECIQRRVRGNKLCCIFLNKSLARLRPTIHDRGNPQDHV